MKRERVLFSLMNSAKRGELLVMLLGKPLSLKKILQGDRELLKYKLKIMRLLSNLQEMRLKVLETEECTRTLGLILAAMKGILPWLLKISLGDTFEEAAKLFLPLGIVSGRD